MKVRSILAGSILLALLGGCATYDDGYVHYRDGRYYGDGYYSRNDRYPYYERYSRNERYPYYDGRYHGDWDHDYFYRNPDFNWGFGYHNPR